MPLSRSQLITIHNTLRPTIPKDYRYLIGYIHGFYPKPECPNIATLKHWISDTSKVQKGVIAWFRACKHQTKYSAEYKMKVQQKIKWLEDLLTVLHSHLPK